MVIKKRMTSKRLGELKEVNPQDNSNKIFNLLIIIILLLSAFLIYSFVHIHILKVMHRDEPNNRPFPNLKFGEESFQTLIQVCADKYREDSCNFIRSGEINKTIEGICREGNLGDLICIPN